MYSQGYKVVEVKESGFGKILLIFDSYQEANRCLKDKGVGGGIGRYINFVIPDRSKKCRGVIAGWDKKSTLDELVSVMVDSSGIIEMERIKRRVFDKETRSVRKRIYRIS